MATGLVLDECFTSGNLAYKMWHKGGDKFFPGKGTHTRRVYFYASNFRIYCYCGWDQWIGDRSAWFMLSFWNGSAWIDVARDNGLKDTKKCDVYVGSKNRGLVDASGQATAWPNNMPSDYAPCLWRFRANVGGGSSNYAGFEVQLWLYGLGNLHTRYYPYIKNIKSPVGLYGPSYNYTSADWGNPLIINESDKNNANWDFAHQSKLKGNCINDVAEWQIGLPYK